MQQVEDDGGGLLVLYEFAYAVGRLAWDAFPSLPRSDRIGGGERARRGPENLGDESLVEFLLNPSIQNSKIGVR